MWHNHFSYVIYSHKVYGTLVYTVPVYTIPTFPLNYGTPSTNELLFVCEIQEA